MKTFYLLLICLMFAFVVPEKTFAEGEKRVEKIMANSIRWGDFKFTYTYDECGKYSLAVREKIDGEELLDWDLHAYTYDENGNLISEIYHYYDEVWTDCDSITYNYDENGNMLQRYYIYWYDTQWMTMKRTTNTYDESGNMLTTTIDVGDYDGTGWMPSSRTSNTFDSEGNLTAEYKEKAVDAILQNYFRSKYTYNDKNLATGYIQEKWTDKWDLSLRYTIVYDDKDKKIETLYERISKDVWSNISRNKYSYNENGDVLVRSFEIYSVDTWVGHTRYTYTWNNANKLLLYLTEKWVNEEYQKSKRETFTLAEGGYRINQAHHEWVAEQWIDADEYIGTTDSAGNQFFFNGFYNMEMHWSGGVPVESEANNDLSSLSCFPNPTFGLVNIDYKLTIPGAVSVTISNTQGNEISRICDNQIQDSGNHRFTYNTSDLAPGVYYITIQSNEFSETKKFVVVR